MKRRRKLILLALVLVVVLALCSIFVPSGTPDPIFNGKHMSYWLRLPTKMYPLPPPDFNAPPINFGGVDSNAMALLVFELDRRDVPFHRTYSTGWQKLPGWLQACLPKPTDTTIIRQNALMYLMNPRTFDSPQVSTSMARILEKDEDISFRQRAAFFLAEAHSKDPAVIQALVHGLRDQDLNVRWYSTNALRQLDPAAFTNAMSK